MLTNDGFQHLDFEFVWNEEVVVAASKEIKMMALIIDARKQNFSSLSNVIDW
jgi:hypothetical protein